VLILTDCIDFTAIQAEPAYLGEQEFWIVYEVINGFGYVGICLPIHQLGVFFGLWKIIVN
jgi:hypothetical protein